MFTNNILALAGLTSLATAFVAPVPRHAVPRMHRNETVPTTTKVVDEFTTFCPEPTTFEMGGHTFEVEEATTLTITDCPCTITEPCFSCKPVPTATATLPPSHHGPPAPPGPPGAAPTSPPEESPEQPPPVTGGAEANQKSGFAALAGAAMFGLLAL